MGDLAACLLVGDEAECKQLIHLFRESAPTSTPSSPSSSTESSRRGSLGSQSGGDSSSGNLNAAESAVCDLIQIQLFEVEESIKLSQIKKKLLKELHLKLVKTHDQSCL